MKPKTNKEKLNSILDEIRSFGYTIEDLKITDRYFIFSYPKNGIYNFKIKELPNFYFGIWKVNINKKELIKQIQNNNFKHLGTYFDDLQIPSNSEFVFFCQNINSIDKFKPSRSIFVTGLHYSEWEEQANNEKEPHTEHEWGGYRLERVLTYIKKHPIKATVCSYLSEDEVLYSEINNFKILHYFIESWYYYYKDIIKDKYKYIKAKRLGIRLAKKLKNYKVLVRDLGENISNRISIYIRCIKDYDDKTINKDDKLIENYYNKYYNLFNIESCNVFDYKVDDLNDKETIEEDNKLLKRFNNIIDSEDVIYKNFKEDKIEC